MPYLRFALIALFFVASCQSSGAGPGGGKDAGSDPAGADAGEPSGESADGGGGAIASCDGVEQDPETDSVWTLESGGRERSFRVHVPASYAPDQPSALVLDFHGYGASASQQVYLSQMIDKSDAEGFIAVHPEGIGLSQSWNAGACCGTAASQDIDDVAFVSAMLDELQSRLCIDPARVFATGMSNGGFMSHRLACELSDRIAAVAPVAGPLGIPSCTPGRPVPVLHFHGTSDLIVPYEGSGAVGYPSVEQMMEGWAERNGCDMEREVTFENGDSTCETFLGCPEGGETVLCTVEGGGHTWPGGTPVPALGKTTTDLSATDQMWTFFSEHPL